MLYPGSFDPFHLGHLDVAAQAASIFGRVVIAVMHNPEKPTGMFSIDERVKLVKESTAHLAGVSVEAHAGLAVDAAKKVGATCIVKSLRSATDFDVESQMAHTNYTVSGVRTMVLFALPEHAYISSRFVREIAHYGGDASAMVTDPVAKALAGRARR
ncbi:MAG: pantetheine-phosphate adenylyltransferase [Actinobacteria bacterium]|nr:pantetheine-phosphate adenylyltransferase [Actinomycetota bacterium]NCZ55698.1 pantetheine-phosphate adenylyltransferase [Acidimicrobiia bacterium]NCX79324.1 pantetheine-phosphate adenylyltransferase [Actinomycetota bacterium]NCZ67183.1 pantetheine-phosphate adenylyltransferase [Acidimicrobiia bacterium]NCZ87963.1 pantetheine-phosphate adenylyltransferase [Actinomycetota bacterium]